MISRPLVTLKTRTYFLVARKRGDMAKSCSIMVQKVPVEGLETLSPDVIHLGFTVSKKQSKKAVERNRIRRRLRAVAAQLMPGRADPRYYYVLIGRRSALTRDYKALLMDLRHCLKTLGTWQIR